MTPPTPEPTVITYLTSQTYTLSNGSVLKLYSGCKINGLGVGVSLGKTISGTLVWTQASLIVDETNDKHYVGLYNSNSSDLVGVGLYFNALPSAPLNLRQYTLNASTGKYVSSGNGYAYNDITLLPEDWFTTTSADYIFEAES